MIKVKGKLEELKNMYNREETAFVIDSMIEGLTHSEVYVDNIEKPNIALVWDRGHCFYFGGEGIDDAKYYEAAEFFKKNLLTQEIKGELRAAKLYFTSERWERVLLDSLTEFKAATYPRTLFRHGFRDISEHINSGSIIKEITKELLVDKEIGNIELMRDEIRSMWKLEKKFLKNGFGYCALEGENIVAWCTAEYVSRGACGIGIETLEDYQKRGIATELCLNFVNKCRKLNITPYWDCWTRNIPSVRVAEKAGFERVSDYKIVFVIFK